MVADKHKLSRLHEKEIHVLLGGHNTKSSGNQWHDAADGKHDPYEDLSFAWDCKSAMPQTKSMSFSRKDLGKIKEQGRGRKPMMPFRFYDTERGGIEFDTIMIMLDDFTELVELAKIGIDVRDDCCEKAYYCPTVDERECPDHSGFDVCCESPERHRRF